MEKKPYRPPFWESKVYGEPYGDFNRRPPPRAVVRVAKPAPGRPTLNLNGDPVARRSVRDLDASSALAAARARSDFNRLVHVRDDPRAADAAYTRVASCPTLPGSSATCAPRSEPRAPCTRANATSSSTPSARSTLPTRAANAPAR